MSVLVLILLLIGIITAAYGMFTKNVAIILGSILFISIVVEFYNVFEILNKQYSLAREISKPIRLTISSK